MVVFSPDGHRLASAGDDGRVRLWNADTGQLVGVPLVGDTKSVNVVAFSPDGHRLASAGDDGMVRLWNADTGQPLGAPLDGHTRDVESVTFSPDGTRIASGSLDGTVWIWPAIATPEMICDKLTTNMSHQQWRDWVSPDIDYIEVCPLLPIAPDAPLR
jgi:WD40 repeat protein